MAFALAVFAERGFAGASLTAVAAAADVAVSAIYYHFPGKPELFNAVLAAACESFAAAIDDSTTDVDPNTPAAFDRAVEASFRWCEEHPDAAKILNGRQIGVTRTSSLLIEEHRSRFGALMQRYAAAADSSDPIDSSEHPDVELAARTITHLMTSVMPLRLEGGLLGRRSAKSLMASLRVVNRQIMLRA